MATTTAAFGRPLRPHDALAGKPRRRIVPRRATRRRQCFTRAEPGQRWLRDVGVDRPAARAETAAPFFDDGGPRRARQCWRPW